MVAEDHEMRQRIATSTNAASKMMCANDEEPAARPEATDIETSPKTISANATKPAKTPAPGPEFPR